MHDASPEGWVVREDLGHALVVLLHLRDAAGAYQDSRASQVPRLEPEVPRSTELATVWSAAGVAPLWLQLWTGELHVESEPGEDPRVRLVASATSSGIPDVFLAALDDAFYWADLQKRETINSFKAWTRPQRLAVNDAVTQARVPSDDVRIQITSIPVQGSWSQLVAPSHLLVSRRLREDTASFIPTVVAVLDHMR